MILKIPLIYPTPNIKLKSKIKIMFQQKMEFLCFYGQILSQSDFLDEKSRFVFNGNQYNSKIGIAAIL